MPILKGQVKPGQAAGKPANQGTVKPGVGKQQQQPAPATPTDAFAKRYAGTDAASGGSYVPPPPGSYNALVTEGQGVVDGDATSAYLELTICNDVEGDESVQGKTCRVYFNFTDENGQEAQGWPYFKSAMQQLGYTEDFKSWDEMTEALANIAANEVWIVIDVKKKGKWTNVYISSVPENQDDKPAYQ